MLTPQEMLIAGAFELLDAIGYHPKSVRIDLQDAEGKIHLRFNSGKPDATAESRLIATGCKPFSALEQRILEALEVLASSERKEKWVSAERLGELIGETVGHDFRAIIRNLGERGGIEVQQGKGCRLPLDPSPGPDPPAVGKKHGKQQSKPLDH
jgi:hypothetical protein